MADTRLPDLARATIPSGIDFPASTSQSKAPLEDVDAPERVTRLKERFLFAWHHPKWIRWREESKEDFDFHSGVGQWDEGQKARLESEGRPALSFNRIRSILGIVIGYERGARQEMKPVPTHEAPAEDVEVFGMLMKKVSNDQEADFVYSDGFKSGAVGGLGAWYIGIDYADDLIHGRVQFEEVPAGEFLYDPSSRKYDLSDAREVFWHKMVPIEALKALYDDKADAIDAALTNIGTGGLEDTRTLPARDPYDGYRLAGLDGSLSLYDPDRREVRVVEAWFLTWATVKLLVDETRNTVDEIPDNPAALEMARALKAADPTGIRIVTQQRRRIEKSVFLPATNTELDFGNPFENDLENYPFVQFLPYREGDEMLGLVRNLKDPQREYNKRRSAMIDNAGRFGSIKWWALRNALENPEFLEQGQGAGNVGYVRGSMENRPVPVVPPEMPAWVAQMDVKAGQELHEIANIHEPIQGQSKPGDSGVKVARLQAAGQVGMSEMFDNARRSKRLIGKRVGKRIQQVYTGSMTERLVDKAGESQFVTLNEEVVDFRTGQITVKRDIPSLKFDVELVESPSTPTARTALLAGLLEIIQQFPEYKDALADLVIEATDVPNRAEVLDRVRKIQAMRLGGAPMGGGQGNGTGPRTPAEAIQARMEVMGSPEAQAAQAANAAERVGV